MPVIFDEVELYVTREFTYDDDSKFTEYVFDGMIGGETVIFGTARDIGIKDNTIYRVSIEEVDGR